MVVLCVLVVNGEDGCHEVGVITKTSSREKITDVRHTSQAREKNTNSDFWVRISSGGVGGLPREGMGAKKFGMSLETQEKTKAGISRGCPRI